MQLPVYILIRTSGRPRFFARAMESVKNQTYENIQTIVHTDDPRDEYVEGDIIIRDSAYGPEYGSGFYNLYNNRLLNAIPDAPGWYCFLDDDDEYAAPDVIARLVEASKPDHINVGRVQRRLKKNVRTFPEKWKAQKSFQTECFFLHTDYKNRAKWWPHLGGDHYYSKQFTTAIRGLKNQSILPINWIENLVIAKSQEGKGHGDKLDAGGAPPDYRNAYPPHQKVPCLGLVPVRATDSTIKIGQGEFKLIPYRYAYVMEQQGKVKITYAQNGRLKPPIRNIYGIGA